MQKLHKTKVQCQENSQKKIKSNDGDEHYNINNEDSEVGILNLEGAKRT